jgi:hypothetical protein
MPGTGIRSNPKVGHGSAFGWVLYQTKIKGIQEYLIVSLAVGTPNKYMQRHYSFRRSFNGDHCIGLSQTEDLLGFDVFVSDLAEPILGHPNVTELSYLSCNREYFCSNTKAVDLLIKCTSLPVLLELKISPL